MTKVPYEIIEIWTVIESLGERGIPGKTIGHFRYHRTAVRAAEGQGWWGGPGIIKKGVALKIGDKIFALSSDTPIKIDETEIDEAAELRAQALAKLSAEERAALGLEV